MLTASRSSSSIFGLTQVLNVHRDQNPVNQVRKAIRDVLSAHDNWLMVLENVSDMSLVQAILHKREGSRHFIFVTGDETPFLGLNPTIVRLGALSLREALQLFHGLNSEFESSGENADPLVAGLVNELKFHPYGN